MAYTRNYSTTLPQGNAAANTLDTVIQNYRVDIKERLESVFDNLDTDPLAFKASFITYIQSLAVVRIPQVLYWSAGQPIELSQGWSAGNLSTAQDGVHPDAISSDLEWIIPLDRFAGVTIDDIVARVYRDAGASVVLRFYKVTNAGPPVFTQIGFVASASTGWHTISLTGQATLIDPTVGSFYALLDMQSDGSNANSARFLLLTVDD